MPKYRTQNIAEQTKHKWPLEISWPAVPCESTGDWTGFIIISFPVLSPQNKLPCRNYNATAPNSDVAPQVLQRTNRAPYRTPHEDRTDNRTENRTSTERDIRFAPLCGRLIYIGAISPYKTESKWEKIFSSLLFESACGFTNCTLNFSCAQ